MQHVSGRHCFFKRMVPGGGFEPPTRGFSIRCSTPELPGREHQMFRRAAIYIRSKLICPPRILVNFIIRPFWRVRGIVRHVHAWAGDDISALEPPGEIHIGAAFTAERCKALIRKRTPANRARLLICYRHVMVSLPKSVCSLTVNLKRGPIAFSSCSRQSTSVLSSQALTWGDKIASIRPPRSFNPAR